MIRFHKSTKHWAVTAAILLMCFTIMITLSSPPSFSDWREWVGVGLTIVGGAVAITGAAITSPVWGPVLGISSVVVTSLGAGITIGDLLGDLLDDSDEDAVCSDCNATYGRGGPHYCILDSDPDLKPKPTIEPEPE